MLDAVAKRSFDEILAGVEEEIGDGAFSLWFRDCVFSGLERGTLRIGVRTPFVREWVERNYLRLIARRTREVIGAPLEIAIEVDEELARRHREDVRRVDAEIAESGQPLEDERAEERGAGLAEFVITPENEFPFRIVAEAARGENPGHNPLVVVGGPGSGKSHLLGAFRRAPDAPRRAPRSVVLKALEFTSRFTFAVKTRNVEEFRAWYDRFDVVVIDEVHRLAGKKATQAELVTLMKRWLESGKRVVLASRHHPRQVHELSPALRSLLLGGMVAHLRPYSKRSLGMIVGGAIGPDRRPVSADVVACLAEGCRGNVRELRTRIIRVCGFAGLQGAPVDLDFVRRHFGELVTPRRGEDGREEVVDAVCRHFEVRREDLASKSKRRTLLLPRGLVACVLRERLALTLKEIGALLGGRSHTSIHLLIRRYGPILEADPEMRELRDRLGDLAAGVSEADPASTPA